MVAFRHICKEVESSIIVDEERLRVSTLTANVVWTLHRIADEEDRPVQANDIVVSFATRSRSAEFEHKVYTHCAAQAQQGQSRRTHV